MSDNQGSQPKNSGGIVWMLSTFALVGILIGLGVSSMNDGASGQTSVTTPPTNEGTAPTDQGDYEAPTTDDDAMLGDPNAPVTMIIFSDYQCPYCNKFETDTMVKIKQNFVDTGLVNVVFRDFPLGFHENAHIAAEAAECAGDTSDEMYWNYHQALVDNYDEWSEYGEGINELLAQYAADLGLSYDTVLACLNDGTNYDEVENDLSDGRNSGIQGTPSFYINGQMVVGALPYDNFMDQSGAMKDGFETILNNAVSSAS